MAGRLKNVLATYNEAEDLINIGAYKSGSNKNIDYAISKIDAVNEFLRQQRMKNSVLKKNWQCCQRFLRTTKLKTIEG